MSEPPTPTVLPPAQTPVLDANNTLTLPWRRALQNLGTAASGSVTPAELAAVAAEAEAAATEAANALAVAEEALAEAGTGVVDPFALAAMSVLDGALTVTSAYTLARPRTFSYTGDATGGPTSFNGSANVSTALTLANTAVTPGTYGDATNVAQFTVDSKGRLTFAGNVPISGAGFGTVTSVGISSPGSTISVSGSPITTSGTIGLDVLTAPKWTTARTLSFTGDATGSGSVDGSASVATGLTLATVNSNVGTFGDASNIAQFTVNAKGLITAASNVAITVPAGANPTGTVGLSAVNGVATTFLRSDGAPALSQAIAPTWSAAHIFNVAGASATPAVKVNGAWFSGGGSTNTKPQLLVEPSGTTSTNWNASGTGIGVNAPSGFGGLLLDLQFNNTRELSVDRFGGVVAGTIDAGGGSPAFRLAPSNSPPAIIMRDTSQLAWTATSTANGTLDTFFTRRGAANIQVGAADAASPVAQTLTSQGSRSGTDSNVGGGNLTIQAGRGTGNATGSSLILQSPVPVASGTGAQTQTTGLTVLYGVAKLTSYTVANLPAAATVGNGCRAYVTDATLAYNGTNLGAAAAGGGANGSPVITIAGAWVIG